MFGECCLLCANLGLVYGLLNQIKLFAFTEILYFRYIINMCQKSGTIYSIIF